MRTWRLKEVFFQPGDADCRDQGRGDGALLTPDVDHAQLRLLSGEALADLVA